MTARETLAAELRRHALVLGEVTLTSGATAQYYVDAKRAILRPAGFRALAELVAGYAGRWDCTAVGGLTMGADAPACAALAGGAEAIRAAAAGAPYEALVTIDDVHPNRPERARASGHANPTG